MSAGLRCERGAARGPADPRDRQPDVRGGQRRAARRRRHPDGGGRVALLLLAFVGAAAVLRPLEADSDRGWWLWTCLAGFGLGVFGWSTAGGASRARSSAGRAHRVGTERSGRAAPRTRSGRPRRRGGCRAPARAAAAAALLRASRTSEWAPQPWSNETTRPSSLASPLAHTPNDCGQRAGEPDQEAARRAGLAAPTGPAPSRGRCRRRTSAGPPGRGPRARARGRVRGRAPRRPRGSGPGRRPRRRVVTEGVRRAPAAGRRRLDGQQVTGAEVAGLDPLAVGHPLGGDDRLLAGEQHDLVDGDVSSGGWRPRHGDRPAPAAVAGRGGTRRDGSRRARPRPRRRGARPRRRRRPARAARRAGSVDRATPTASGLRSGAHGRHHGARSSPIGRPGVARGGAQARPAIRARMSRPTSGVGGRIGP